ncbi:putative membrane protein, partial [Yersinia pestis PY-53]
MRIDVKQRVKT